MIKSIILAAGKGTRMKSDTPKVLHTIFDKTLVGYVIDAVNNTGLADENFVIVGHQAERVEEYINKNYDNAKCVLQSPQLGTGHAVSMALPYLKDFDGEVIILCGDTPLITSETIKEFVEYHRDNKSDLTVMSAIFENPTNYGRIIRNQDDSLNSIVEEKDATPEQKAVKEINAGIYCINWAKIKSAFNELTSNNAQGEYYLTDIIKWGNEKNLSVNAYTLKNNEEIFGINSKTHLAEATKMLNNKIVQKHLDNGVQIIDPATTWISPETEIGADTVIYPSCYINGKNKIVIEKPPKNMSARQKDVWEKLQAGRKRDAEKNRLHIYDMINICEFGGNYHIPISEIETWTLWKLTRCYNSITGIKEYNDSLKIGIANYDLSSVQKDNYWIKKMMIRD